MLYKCAHAPCGKQLDKKHEVQINGVVKYFCPQKYAPHAPDCLTLYIREHHAAIYQYRVIAVAS